MLKESYPRMYKSAPLPEKPQENHITNVVGRNFNEVVLDPHKDVLLMVYVNRYDAPPLLNALYKFELKIPRHSLSPILLVWEINPVRKRLAKEVKEKSEKHKESELHREPT